MQTVLANRVFQFGSSEVIAFEQIPLPVPGPGEVRIRVKAAGVGPWDVLVRSGKSGLPQPLPLTLGSDLSGTVEAVGEGVTGVSVDDEVFGATNPSFTGAYAEAALARASMIAPKPRRLSHVEAASVPVVAVTAWQMLFERARFSPGQTVVVLGAAGNVGAYAVQLAHGAEARVIAVARPESRDYVFSLRPDQVIASIGEAPASLVGKVDVVIDTVGGELQRRAAALLKPDGRLISSAGREDPRADFFFVEVTTARLQRVGELIDAGKLSVSVSKVLPLQDAREAHDMLERRRPRPPGKIVLTPGLR